MSCCKVEEGGLGRICVLRVGVRVPVHTSRSKVTSAFSSAWASSMAGFQVDTLIEIFKIALHFTAVSSATASVGSNTKTRGDGYYPDDGRNYIFYYIHNGHMSSRSS